MERFKTYLIQEEKSLLTVEKYVRDVLLTGWAFFLLGAVCFAGRLPVVQRWITALLPPLFSLVTTICLSIRSFSSVTWEMIPTRRLPSVRPASVL